MSPAIRLARICAALGFAAAFAASFAIGTGARAQAADDASTTAGARALAVEGVKLAQAGHCDDAIEKLERAEALHHAPIVLGQLGECYVAQGRLVAGTELLRSVLREALPAAPSPALRKAYAHAQLALDTAAPKIALLTIHVNAAAAEHASVTIDGQPVPPALLGAERPTDPGEHVIEVASPGYRPARAHLTLIAGDTQSVSINLEVDPAAIAENRATELPSNAVVPAPILEGTPYRDTAPAAYAKPAQHSAPNHTAAYVSWALSGVALGIGAGFGIAAAGEKNDLEPHCPGSVCSSDRASALDSAKRDGTISTIGFSIAAAAAAVGTVLFLLSDHDGERP